MFSKKEAIVILALVTFFISIISCCNEAPTLPDQVQSFTIEFTVDLVSYDQGVERISANLSLDDVQLFQMELPFPPNSSSNVFKKDLLPGKHNLKINIPYLAWRNILDHPNSTDLYINLSIIPVSSGVAVEGVSSGWDTFSNIVHLKRAVSLNSVIQFDFTIKKI